MPYLQERAHTLGGVWGGALQGSHTLVRGSGGFRSWGTDCKGPGAWGKGLWAELRLPLLGGRGCC